MSLSSTTMNMFIEGSVQMLCYIAQETRQKRQQKYHHTSGQVKHENATPVYVLKREAKDDAAKSAVASLLRNSTDLGFSSTLAQWKA